MIHYLLLSSGITWVMLVLAALLRTGATTPSGLKVAVGNRDNLPPPSALAARADRAAKNMLENLVLFACVALAASLAGADPARASLGCQVFLFARIAYAVIYVAGIEWLRTLSWAAGVAGIAMVAVAAW